MSTREKKVKSSKTDDKKSQKKTEEVTIVVDHSITDAAGSPSKLEDEQNIENGSNLPEPKAVEEDKEVKPEEEDKGPSDASKLTEILVERYEGDFVRGQYEGEGKCWFYDGNQYEGEFSQGMMHGNGTFSWVDGLSYEGEFFFNSVTGKGKYTWPDGSTYNGDVLNGLRHGVGTFVDKNGILSYTGEWIEGKRQGKGRMNYVADGSSYYDGEWVNNIRHGHGTRQYPSGNMYKGMWFNNVRHGDGTMKWVDTNQMYIGQWEDGIQHGLGQHVWFVRRVPGSQYTLRNTYNGEFVKGIRHGYGTFYYANGAKYEGYWYNNMKHGKGRFTFKNGRYYEGQFESDHIKEYPNFDMDGTSTPDVTAIRTRTPLPMDNISVHSNMSVNTTGPSFQIDLSNLLKATGLEYDESDSRQVSNVVRRHISALKKVYDFYSTLGFYESSDNTFILSHIQFHRMMRDCQMHYRHLTLIDMDRLLEFESSKQQNPHDRILFREFINHIVTLAIHLYKDEYTTDGSVNYAQCINQLISTNILKHACKVRGHFFFETRRASHALEYLDDSYQVFKSACKPQPKKNNQHSLKMRDFLFLMRDLKLINSDLDTKTIVQLLTEDNPNATDEQDGYNLEHEITFLEFFESLVGCAEFYVTEAVAKDPSSSPIESSGGGLKSATGGRGAQAADQISLASEPTSGRSGVGVDHEDEGEGKSTAAPPTPRSVTPAAPKTAASQADRVQSSVTAGASVSKAKTETSESVVGLKAESAMGGALSNAAPSGADALSEVNELENEKTMDLDNLGDVAEEGDGFDQLNDELDDTRKFNFWTHQLFIFFVMKFFPAYHNYMMLKQLVREKSGLHCHKANHSKNCICRGQPQINVTSEKSVGVVPSTAEASQSAPHPLTPALSITEQV